MTLNYEDESGLNLGLPLKEIAEAVIQASLKDVGCPWDAEVNLLVTGEERIREMNRDFRGIDRVTDVLSFPMLEFERSGDFSFLRKEEDDSAFNPSTGELLLGDIVICAGRAALQAQEYGHSVKREFAFLTAHSMLHLTGFDHMEEKERLEMEEHQRRIMEAVEIVR